MITHFYEKKRDVFVTPNCCSVKHIGQEELMGWHLSGVTITRIRVTGGKFQ